MWLFLLWIIKVHAFTAVANRSSGSAIDDVLGDRAAIEAHFGFHPSDDESNLYIPSEDKMKWGETVFIKANTEYSVQEQ